MKGRLKPLAHIAEDVSVQGRPMYPRALCVPQADGVVRGAGNKGTGGKTGLITVLYLGVDLKKQRVRIRLPFGRFCLFKEMEKGMKSKTEC